MRGWPDPVETLPRGPPSSHHLAITKAVHGVVVHHPDGLHEGVADGGANEGKSSPLKIFTHCVGLNGPTGDLAHGPPGIHPRFAADKLPDVAVEGAVLALHTKERGGILNRGRHFQTVAHDAFV